MHNFTDIYAIGLMSDTDLEGVYASLIRTNGMESLTLVKSIARPYDEYLAEQLRALMGPDFKDFPGKLKKAEFDLTMASIDAVNSLIQYAGINREEVKIIGFHGHTLYHNPQKRQTYQLGNGQMLADETGIPMVNHFATNDLLAGGNGEPLMPVYLSALYEAQKKPLAVIHLGGVSTVIFIDGNQRLKASVAGPGMSLLNRFMHEEFGMDMDYDGGIASSGKADETLIGEFMQDGYFANPPPKSPEFGYFKKFLPRLRDIRREDAAATLTALIARAILDNLRFSEEKPKQAIVSGGGSKNPYLMRLLRTGTDVEITPSINLGVDPHMLVAQGYAYIATRTLYGLPSSFPETTGAREATILGTLRHPAVSSA